MSYIWQAPGTDACWEQTGLLIQLPLTSNHKYFINYQGKREHPVMCRAYKVKTLEERKQAYFVRTFQGTYFAHRFKIFKLIVLLLQYQRTAGSGQIRSDQPLSRVQLCDPMNRSTPGLPVHHQLPEFTQTHVHRVDDVIKPSHPLLSPSPSAFNLSQHQGLF